MQSRSSRDEAASAPRGVLLAFVIGISAIAVALVAAFYAVGFVGTREDVIIVLNGVDLHRPVSTETAVLVSLLLGTFGSILVLRSWPRIRRRW